VQHVPKRDEFVRARAPRLTSLRTRLTQPIS
jgi:hypothetical protein